MSCVELFLKSASSTFTGYFLIISATFVLYGLSTTNYLLRSNSVATLEEEYVSLPSLCLVLFGLLMLLFIIMGCCAICREIPCCLESYSIFLSVLAAVQIGLGIFCLIHFNPTNPQFAERIYDDVTKMYVDYEDNPHQMDSTQEWMKCCGVTGPYNWLKDNKTIPLSCCENAIDGNCTLMSPSRFSEGCSFMVFSYITGTNYIIGWALIIVGITEIIAAMMGISLSCAFWRNNRVMWI